MSVVKYFSVVDNFYLIYSLDQRHDPQFHMSQTLVFQDPDLRSTNDMKKETTTIMVYVSV